MLPALGPSLSEFSIDGPLADPVLELHDQTGVIGTNDNWQTIQLGGVITAEQQAEILASTIFLNDPVEAAIIANVDPGPYTAIVRGANNGTGTGLAEVYDLSPTAPAMVANLSTRGYIQTEDDVLIGGFIVRIGVVESRRRPCARPIAYPRLEWLTPSPIQSSTCATLIVCHLRRTTIGPTPSEKP